LELLVEDVKAQVEDAWLVRDQHQPFNTLLSAVLQTSCHMHATVTNDASTELHGAGVDCRVNKYIQIILFEHMASILVGPDPPAMLQVHLAMGGPFIDHRLCHMHATVTNDGSFFLSTWHRF